MLAVWDSVTDLSGSTNSYRTGFLLTRLTIQAGSSCTS